MKQSHIAIIGAPMDLGAGRRGVDMGPSAMRLAGLNEKLSGAGLRSGGPGQRVGGSAGEPARRQSRARYLPQIAHTCTRLAEMVEKAADTGACRWCWAAIIRSPSARWPACRGIFAKRSQAGPDLDRRARRHEHARNQPQRQRHGMPLACCIGLGPRELTHIGGHAPKVEPASVALIGLRSVDEVERLNVRGTGVHAFTMRDIDERGMRAVIEEAIDIVTAGTAGFHLSFDMDAVDPREAPGVGTPVRGGITYREAHLAMELVCDSGRMTSLEVVEVNPVIDEANRTALLAVELATSALGKTNSMKLRVAVLYGGRSGEHEISLRSAESIIAAMDPQRYEVQRIFIIRKAAGSRARFRPSPAATRHRRGVSGAARHLRRGWHRAGAARTGRSALRRRGRAGSAVSMDKDMMKRLLRERGLPVVEFVVLSRAASTTWTTFARGCRSRCS